MKTPDRGGPSGPQSAPTPAAGFDRPAPAGLEVRALAVRLIAAVIEDGRSLDDTLARELGAEPALHLAPRDKGLARLIAATVLRRKGQLEAVIGSFLEKPLPADRGRLGPILLAAAAQLLFLGIAPHAVINIAVEQCRHDRGARRFDRLANAVLRRTAERGAAVLAARTDGDRLNIPDWLWARWLAAYGEERAGQIATASLQEAALDVTVKSDSEGWALQLGGLRLATGSVRLLAQVRVEELPGFAEGAWWVQDAAAALPALLLGDVRDQDIADLCAAPGGKTAQLVARGARVTAVEQSEERIVRLRQNLQRLGLEADIKRADAASWNTQRTFDGVLVDAPCIATGTIRRHPDIPHLKRPGDITQLAEVQARLIDRAFALLKPGGRLVYCTCSLEPEEGPEQIRRFLERQPGAARQAISAEEVAGEAGWITPDGDLRTLPFHLPHAEPRLAGMDGFFAARLVRVG